MALQDGIWLLSTFSFSRITIILEELESLALKQMQHPRCTGEAWSQLTSTESVGLTWALKINWSNFDIKKMAKSCHSRC